MDFAPDARTRELTERARAFLDEHVLPAEPVLDAQLAATPDEWGARPVVRELQAQAREQGLWNLFLPGDRRRGPRRTCSTRPSPSSPGGARAWRPSRSTAPPPTPATWRCSHDFGTPEQKERWLEPLLDAEIRSAFCMTEPDVASSDATNIAHPHPPRRRRLRDHRPQVVVDRAR